MQSEGVTPDHGGSFPDWLIGVVLWEPYDLTYLCQEHFAEHSRVSQAPFVEYAPGTVNNLEPVDGCRHLISYIPWNEPDPEDLQTLQLHRRRLEETPSMHRLFWMEVVVRAEWHLL